MHKFNMSFVFQLCILRLTSWIWTNPSTERAEIWEPFKMKLVWGFQSWILTPAWAHCTLLNYKVHVSSKMRRIKNQPSNSTSCSDNALRLLVLVAGILHWGLWVYVFFFNSRLCHEGLFLREVYFEGPNHVEGHRKLQSWTLHRGHECTVHPL